MTTASQAPPQAHHTSTSPRPDAVADLDARDHETAPLSGQHPRAACDQNHQPAPGSPTNSHNAASAAAVPQRNGVPTLPVMVRASLLMVLTAALLTQLTTYWIMGAAVALEAAALASSITWLMWLMADREQNPQPPQKGRCERTVVHTASPVARSPTRPPRPNPA